MQSEELNQHEEIYENDQSMERPRISNSGTGVDRLEMSFDGKRYVHGQHSQLLMIEEKYDTSKDIDTYISLAHDVMFTKMSAKKGIKNFG